MTQAPELSSQAAEATADETLAVPAATPSVATPPQAADVNAPQASVPLKHTPLHSLHVSRAARMVPFAGYDMPVQYADGIIAEHTHTRTQAGLFDVSHMGQAFLVGADHDTVARALGALVPGDLAGLAPGRQRYTQLTDEGGGIL